MLVDIGFHGRRRRQSIAEVVPDLMKTAKESVLFHRREAGKCLVPDCGNNIADLSDHVQCLWRQEKCPGPPIGGMDPAFDESSRLESIHQADHGDRLDVEALRESRLAQALIMGEMNKHIALSRAEWKADLARTLIEPTPQKTCHLEKTCHLGDVEAEAGLSGLSYERHNR